MNTAVQILLLIPCLAVAEEQRSLGKSPDGKFELVLQAERPDDYGWVVIKNTSSGEVAQTETSQGYSYFSTDDVEASWKGDSTAFAIGVRGTKTTTETDIYVKDGEVWEKIEFPPFVANILGRQGVFSKGRNQNIDFAGFEGDSRFSLVCHVEPDFQQKEKAAEITDWKPSQQTDWKVVLEYRLRTRPNCVIVSIEPFDETKSVQDNAGRPAIAPEAKREGDLQPKSGLESRSQ
jgi:hypothetical protein